MTSPSFAQTVCVLYHCSPLIYLLWVFALGPGCILLDNSSVRKLISNIILETPGRFELKQAITHLTPGDTEQKPGLKGTAQSMNLLW